LFFQINDYFIENLYMNKEENNRGSSDNTVKRNEENKISETVALINSHLELKQSNLELKNDNIQTYDFLKKKLHEVIWYLLENNMEKLLTAVYRIDVDERKFISALKEEDSGKISERITDLILERELQKVEFRKKFTS